MSKYYDGTKLLSMLDINGNKPEIYIVTTNRTGGKTTYFSRLLVNKFIKNKEKFCLIYRFNYELDDIADKFFKDINTLFFSGYEMTSKRRANGIYQELFLNDEPCGYAVSINSTDALKKYSHLFSDVNRMLFDEFQSETNHYCSDEIRKFYSLHKTVARGQGKQTRYVPVYMCANPVSIINPYYTALNISARLKHNTTFLRGDGFVLEQGFVESSAKASETSAFERAFKNSDYGAYANQAVYLNDNTAFIEKLEGKNTYCFTVKYKGNEYAVRSFYDIGYIYVDTNVDVSFPNKLVVTTDDHNINYVMLQKHDLLIMKLRYLFDKGCMRFKNIQCKEAILAILSY